MARTDFEPLSWEEAEQNRREHVQGALLSRARAESEFPGVFPELAVVLAENHCRPGKARVETAAEQGERLRSEIKRGREYLEQAHKDLAESRAQLEDWPAYEQTCGKNPLAHLTESVRLNARIARFLTVWVRRREAELDSLSRPTRASAA